MIRLFVLFIALGLPLLLALLFSPAIGLLYLWCLVAYGAWVWQQKDIR